jgi:D-alanyl-D-alanine carboxypeptidase/D-alanyl-D-alanine-endopeptidase (penicillin-binding protein 4)
MSEPRRGGHRIARGWLLTSIALTGVLVVGACTSEPTSSGSGSTGGTMPAIGAALPPDAQAIVDSANYAHGQWNWDAVDLASGETLFAQHENELNFLGSTTKLFTVGTYYDEMGPDATLETPVYATGARTGDSLTGDLVLVGSGDFILGGRGVLDGELEYGTVPTDHVYAYAIPDVQLVTADPLAGLDDLAAQVKASGITSVQGDVLVDDTLFEPYQTKEGELTSIMVNDNLLDIVVTPGSAVGDPVSMRTIPQTAYFDVVNQAVTTAEGGDATVTATLDPATNRIVLAGNLPLGSKQGDYAILAPDSAGFARALFIEALRRAGVTVDAPLTETAGTLPPAGSYTEADTVAALTSAPTSVLTKLVTKISHNRGAETLMCLLAVKAGSKDCEDGLVTMISKFAGAGIEPGTVMIYDGEGSDPSSATPAAMLRWLTWVHEQPFAQDFKDGLPDINKDGSVMVKSGLSARPELSSMPAMFVAGGQAGYMTTASGKEAVVAVYALNGVWPTTPEGLKVPGGDLDNLEQVVKAMAKSS